MLLLIGVFAVIAVTITNSETGTQAGADAKETEKKADVSGDGEKSGSVSGGGMEAAEDLIDQTVSRDEVKESVGE